MKKSAVDRMPEAKRKSLESLLGSRTDEYISTRFGLARGAVARHRLKFQAAAAQTSIAGARPEPPEFEDGISAAEKAARMCAYFQESLKWGTKARLPERELNLMGTQLERWTKLHAKTTGGFDITEAMLIKSPAWGRVMKILEECIGDNFEVLTKLRDKLAAING